jgi:hypothetical protein
MAPKYSVVEWYNYRKELSAGHRGNFNDYNVAREYAYHLAEKDKDVYGNNGPVITQDEITDENGPGPNGGPYNVLIGYGGRDSTGYATTFYCVVEWFDGVENSWDWCDDEEEEWDDDDYNRRNGIWYPRYEC